MVKIIEIPKISIFPVRQILIFLFNLFLIFFIGNNVTTNTNIRFEVFAYFLMFSYFSYSKRLFFISSERFTSFMARSNLPKLFIYSRILDAFRICINLSKEKVRILLELRKHSFLSGALNQEWNGNKYWNEVKYIIIFIMFYTALESTRSNINVYLSFTHLPHYRIKKFYWFI